VLPHFVAVENFARAQSHVLLAAQRAFAPPGCRCDFLQLLLSGRQRLVSGSDRLIAEVGFSWSPPLHQLGVNTGSRQFLIQGFHTGLGWILKRAGE
jgi:hypothetical protein